jgi:aromatic ring-cleaving dioxygenase
MSLAGSLRGYHVHIYYHDATEANAKDLHDQLVSRFGGQPSRPQFTGIAGPHPQMQVIFCKEAFTDLVPCLMFNRQGLDILVHRSRMPKSRTTQHTRTGSASRVDLLTDRLRHAPTIPELQPN